MTTDAPADDPVARFIAQLSVLEDAIRARDVGARTQAPTTARAPHPLDDAHDIVYQHDLTGRITAANRAAAIAFGVAPGALIGVHIGTLMAEDYVPRLIEHALDSPSPEAWKAPFVIQASSHEGRTLWLEVSPHVERVGDDVHGIFVIARDITARRHAGALERRAATHDELTGLANRPLFVEHTDRALARATRDGGQVALLVLDLDRFKLINDGLGFAVGDRLLAAVADRIARTVREADTIARLGGDEFAILLDPIDAPTRAVTAAQRLLEALDAPFVLDGASVHVGASVGIALSPGDGDTGERLLWAADVAMYRAKSDGRGRAAFHRQEAATEAATRLEVEAALRTAVRAEALRLEFRPRVATGGDRVVAFLVSPRIDDSDGQALDPTLVRSVADETGLIGALDSLTVGRACELMAHGAARADSVSIVVPLGDRSVHFGDIAAEVRRRIEAARLPPSRIAVEIDAAALVAADARADAALRGLADAGVGVSVSNVGGPDAPLRALRAPYLSAATLSTDVIVGACGDERATAIAESVVELVRGLGLTAVATGVDDASALRWARDLGFDAVQGAAAGPALDEAGFARFLAV